MSRIDSLRKDLIGIRRFARRLKDEEHDDPLPPPLPPARVVGVTGRVEMFVRQLDGQRSPAHVSLDPREGWLR